MSRPQGAISRALLRAIKAGASGTYTALAQAAGVQPHHARATLKELSRAGQCAALMREPTGRRGPGAAVYGLPARRGGLDALAHVRQVWR